MKRGKNYVSAASAIDKTKQYYIENAFHATVDTKFKVATLGNDAGIFGGAKLSLEI